MPKKAAAKAKKGKKSTPVDTEKVPETKAPFIESSIDSDEAQNQEPAPEPKLNAEQKSDAESSVAEKENEQPPKKAISQKTALAEMASYIQKEVADRITDIDASDIQYVLEASNIPYELRESYAPAIEQAVSDALDQKYQLATRYIRARSKEQEQELNDKRKEATRHLEELRNQEQWLADCCKELYEELNNRVENMLSMT